MSLKEEFKEIAEVMLSYNPKFELRPYYRLVENYKRPYCNIDQECDIEYNDEICSKCTQHGYDIYDLALIVGDDFDIELYNFTESQFGTCILSKEDMLKELKKLQFLILHRYASTIEWYQKFDQLEEFANSFYKTVIEDFNMLLSNDILPIKFYDGWDGNEKAESEELGGEFKYMREGCCNQHIINIYNCSDIDDNLRRTIRHEIIHYILYASYLNNDDSDGIFHALCNIYDGLAYKQMNSDQQSIHDEFMYIYTNIDNLIERNKISLEKKQVLNLMLRYLGRIPWNVNPDFVQIAEPIYKTLIRDYKSTATPVSALTIS